MKAAEGENIERGSIKESQITLLYQAAPFSICTSAVLAILTFFVLHTQVSKLELFQLWLAVSLAVLLVRGVFVGIFLRKKITTNYPFWHRAFTVLTTLSGVTWGTVLLFYSQDWPAAYQLIIWLVIPGLVSGGMSSLCYHHQTFVLYILPMLLFSVGVLLEAEGPAKNYLLPMAALYFAVQLFTARRYNSALLSSMATRMQLLHTNKLLQEVATKDSLTNIPNRRAFEERLEKSWRHCVRNKKPLALMMVDIDHFKRINDQLGHQVGDECLVKAAKLISRQVGRPDDMVARWGGEEFAVMLPDTDLSGALKVAEDIRLIFSEIEMPGFKAITTSVGVAVCQPQLYQSSDLLMRAADEALYEAKAAGRNRVEKGEVMAI